MNIWTKMTWTKIKKSSKAELIPNIKETSPIHRAKIAHP